MIQVHQEHLEAFSRSLKPILDKEVGHYGNVIMETQKGWPKDDTIFVFLLKPFHQRYDINGVRYNEVNDPHWWKEDYFDNVSGHIIACPF